MRHLKTVHNNHLRVSRGEELSVDMLIDELNECQSELKKPVKEELKVILERHISSLKFLIKSRKKN